MEAMLGSCSLDRLRKRQSEKWRAYPADVLPSFVAEMDFDLAEPIVEDDPGGTRARRHRLPA